MNTSLPVDKSKEEHLVNLQKVNFRGIVTKKDPHRLGAPR